MMDVKQESCKYQLSNVDYDWYKFYCKKCRKFFKQMQKILKIPFQYRKIVKETKIFY